MSSLGQGYWECLRVGGTYTRGKGEKDKVCRSTPAAGLSLVYVIRVAVTNKAYYKIEMEPIGGLEFSCKLV